MPISVESSEQAEALVNTLQIEGASLTDANLSGLSSSDLEQLASLQAELDSIEASEIETEDFLHMNFPVEHVDIKPMLDGDIVETEIGEQEVEIEADDDLEEPSSPDEILPDYKEHSEVIKFDSGGAPPPLRPLTIAPKPIGKLPMALKTAAVVNAGSGQQIVLIQSPGGTTNTVNLGGQHIKLVSAQGTPVSLPNLQNVQLASKSGGVVQLRAVSKSQVQQDGGTAQVKTIQGGVKKIIPQNKNILTKVIMGGTSGQVLLDSPQLKLVSTSSNLLPTTTRFTVAQAQQMGLLTSGLQRVTPGTKQTLLMNKPLSVVSVPQQQPGINAIKLAPNKQVKSPHKILPAPLQLQKVQTKEGLQRVIIKQGGQLKTGVVTSGGSGAVNQVIRLPSGQTLNTSSAGQIHQIQVPGKGVQYIRFMTASSASSVSTVTASTATVASGSAGTSSTPSAGALQLKTSQAQKAQVVPVAGITVNRGKVGVGNQQNIIKVVPLSGSQTRPVAPKPITSGQRLLIPATSSQVRPSQTITTIPASALSQIQGTIIPSGNNVSQIVMLPAQYVQQIQNQANSTPKITKPVQKTLKISPQAKETSSTSLSTSTSVSNSANASLSASVAEISSSPESTYSRTLEPNGIRPRKPCNCTKSLCLKLYCDCFANGEFCHLCNCMNCYNNLEKEEERQRAIKNCLERNPNAFRPKIGKGKEAGESSVRKHTKGCNCKRSGCLKNYCECYEAKIACSSNCKCIGCRNIEDSMEKKNVRPLAPMPDLQVVPTAKNKQPPQDVASFRAMISNANKLPSTYMTSEVIEATNQCMIAQADEAERNMMSDEAASKMILEEFGRCLVQIIECSNQAIANT